MGDPAPAAPREKTKTQEPAAADRATAGRARPYLCSAA